MNEVKKNLIFTRIETDKNITIKFNTLYSYFMFYLLVKIVLGFISQSYLVIGIFSFLLLAQWIYSLIFYLPVQKELKDAAADFRVIVSGHKHSLKSPLKVTIAK